MHLSTATVGSNNYSRDFQLSLARHNHVRLEPVLTNFIQDWKAALSAEHAIAVQEGEWIEAERHTVVPQIKAVPRDAEGFLKWFEDLKTTGPGQDASLFPWLAAEAEFAQMRWFLMQEVAGEAGFDDLVALTQLRLPTSAKLELARNYWDEMGRGNAKGMHGPMLTRLAREFDLLPVAPDDVVVESVALANLMVGFAYHRRYAFQSVGALGVVELTAPGRAACVYQGLKRLNVGPEARQYFLLHSTLDVKHSEAWNREALGPLVQEFPEAAPLIAEGAILRLKMGSQCFERYTQELRQDFQAGAALTADSALTA